MADNKVWKPLKPFDYCVNSNIPAVFGEELTYYEKLCRIEQVVNDCINNIEFMLETYNKFASDMSADNQAFKDDMVNKYNELMAVWKQLQDWITHYFDNLDVQEEINNKLDELVSDGTLSNLITPLLPPLVSKWLDDNIPTGETIIVDKTLKIENAGADSLIVGEHVNGRNAYELLKENYNENIYSSNLVQYVLQNKNVIKNQNLFCIGDGTNYITNVIEITPNIAYVTPGLLNKTIHVYDMYGVYVGSYNYTTVNFNIQIARAKYIICEASENISSLCPASNMSSTERHKIFGFNPEWVQKQIMINEKKGDSNNLLRYWQQGDIISDRPLIVIEGNAFISNLIEIQPSTPYVFLNEYFGNNLEEKTIYIYDEGLNFINSFVYSTVNMNIGIANARYIIIKAANDNIKYFCKASDYNAFNKVQDEVEGQFTYYARIKDGKYCCGNAYKNGEASNYTGIEMTDKITAINATVEFETGKPNSANAVFIINSNGCKNQNNVFQSCYHIRLSRARLQVDYIKANTLTNVISNELEEAESYEIQISISGTNITVTVNNTEFTAQMPEDLGGKYFIFQHYAYTGFINSNMPKLRKLKITSESDEMDTSFRFTDGTWYSSRDGHKVYLFNPNNYNK